MKKSMRFASFSLAAALVVGATGLAIAQVGSKPATAGPATLPPTIPLPPPTPLQSALADAIVGEQADGYMGFRGTATTVLRADVDAINIKRRTLYTQLATQRGVTPKEVAAAVGCETLQKRVAVGRAYLLLDGVWRIRKAGEMIDLPDYCDEDKK